MEVLHLLFSENEGMRPQSYHCQTLKLQNITLTVSTKNGLFTQSAAHKAKNFMLVLVCFVQNPLN